MPEASRVTLITAEIMARLAAPEFKPFVIHQSDGRAIEVPTRDHCTITRLLRRIEVETDDVRIFFINPLHVTSIENKRPAA